MNKDRIELWLGAMESNRYPQCFGRMAEPAYVPNLQWRTLANRNAPAALCAVGVAIAIYLENTGQVVTYSNVKTVPYGVLSEWYGVDICGILLEDDEGNSREVVSRNDGNRWSFTEIAQRLRKQYL